MNNQATANGNKVGRPPKITDQKIQEIANTIASGAYPEIAARRHGISSATYYEWMKKGLQRPNSKYAEFREAVLKAKAIAECNDVLIIETAARNGSWQAAMTRLERMYPDRWGRRDRISVDQTVEHHGEIRLPDLSDNKLIEVLNELDRLGILSAMAEERKAKQDNSS